LVEAAKARARARGKHGRGSSLDVSSRTRGTRNDVRQERMTNRKVLLEVFRSRAGKLPVVLEEATKVTHEAIKENVRPEKSFYFQQRHGKLDLRGISRIDLDQLVEDVDIETLQAYLENLTFAELEDHDLRTCTDDTFLKLFRLTQLTIEYLLNVQHTLYAYSGTLEQQLAHVHKEHDLAESRMNLQSEQLQSLQRELKQKRRTLKTYEFLLTQRGSSSGDIESKLEQMSVSSAGGVLRAPRGSMEDAATLASVTNPADALRDRVLEEKTRALQIREDTLKSQQAEFEKQADKMREMLQKEAEEMRRQLAFEMEKQREEQKHREEKLDKQEQDLMNLQRNGSTSTGVKRPPSLAGGKVEDDVDIDIERQVQDILMNANSLEDLRTQLSGVMDQNQRLRDELSLVGTLLHEQRKSKAGHSKHHAYDSEEGGDGDEGNSSKEKDDDTNTQVETGMKKNKGKARDETLMLKLSGAQVSRDLADRRSMQLRRVLRLVRRRLQHQAYNTWRLLMFAKRSQAREQALQEEMKRMMQSGVVKVPDSEGVGFNFEANYEWQNVPSGSVVLNKQFEIRDEAGHKQARIPRVWLLSTLTSLDTEVIVPVERDMTIFQVRERLAQELQKPINVIMIQRNALRGTDKFISDAHTVQSANLFYDRPYVFLQSTVNLANKLSSSSIEALISDYAREKEAIHGKGLGATSGVPGPKFSLIPERPHIQARWHHDPEVVAAAEADIESELSRSFGSLSTASSAYQRRSRRELRRADLEDTPKSSGPRGITDESDAESEYAQVPPVRITPNSHTTTALETPAANIAANSASRVSADGNSELLVPSTPGGASEFTQVSNPRESNVPVNFGDYESEAGPSPILHTPSTDAGAQSLVSALASQSSTGKATVRSLRLHDSGSENILTQDALARRHERALAHFARLGLARRAQVSTLNLSQDSGSSRSVTSMSSQDVSAFGATVRSHFDVERAADQYELGGDESDNISGSDEENSMASSFTGSRSGRSTNSASHSLSESRGRSSGNRRPSTRTQALLDQIADD